MEPLSPSVSNMATSNQQHGTGNPLKQIQKGYLLESMG